MVVMRFYRSNGHLNLIVLGPSWFKISLLRTYRLLGKTIAWTFSIKVSKIRISMEYSL